ncbi:MAG: response regulator transcription factor [Slackia sp.]|nr:response regulator transcription factor [Slackia sp.]
MENTGRGMILVVEDDASISDVIRTTLEREGYVCRCAYSGSEACLLIEGGFIFDAAICDLMLPGATGEEVLAAIRAQGDAPVIVASAKSDVSQRVALLREGADDYLVKPFDLDELLARLEAVLRRKGAVVASGSGGESHGVAFREWRIDEQSRTFSAAGASVSLTRTEFDILAAFVRHPKKVFTKRELFEIVRHEEALTDERTISTHVSNIRRKLKESGTQDYIETVWGIGFKLVEE